MGSAIGTIPYFSTYGSGALPIASTVYLEIVDSLNATSAVSYNMSQQDLVGKAPSIILDANPTASDRIAYFKVASSLPRSCSIGDLGIPSGNLPTGGGTGTILAKRSPTNFDASFTSIIGGPLTVDGALTLTSTGALSFQLLNSPTGIGFVPVPTFYPVASNSLIAFDMCPKGTPVDAGYGICWFDLCNTDVVVNPNLPQQTLHLAATATRHIVASAEYSGGASLPLELGMQDDAVFTPYMRISTSLGVSILTTLGVSGTALFTSGAFGIVGTAIVTGTLGMAGTATFTGVLSINGPIHIDSGDTSVTPSLNTSVFLEIVNENQAFAAGAQIWFGTIPGDPYGMISSYQSAGPSPFQGRLAFGLKPDTTTAIKNLLWMMEAGSVIATDDPIARGFGGPFSVGAYNNQGYHGVITYTNTSAILTPTTGQQSTNGVYAVAENDTASGTTASAIGGYFEGRAGNGYFTAGIEVDLQNTSGTTARIPDPNNIFGALTSGISGYPVWIYNGGTKAPFGIGDVSGAIGITAATTGKFKKGIVFAANSLTAVSTHFEAIDLPANYEIAWYDAAGTTINRLSGNGTTVSITGGLVLGTAAISSAATTGFLYIPTCNGTPTGTPVSFAGRSPLVIDDSNNRLYFYSTGAWRNAGP